MKPIEFGKLITNEEYPKRDAIHVATAQVIASTKLFPGQDVGLLNPGDNQTVGVSDNPIGIVDPFLKNCVYQAERFWIFLYPGTVTGLTHHWEHPAFDKVIDTDKLLSLNEYNKQEAIDWFQKIADCADISYEELMEHISTYVDTEEIYVQQGSQDLSNSYYDDPELFWQRYMLATGKEVSLNKEKYSNSPFCCSC